MHERYAAKRNAPLMQCRKQSWHKVSSPGGLVGESTAGGQMVGHGSIFLFHKTLFSF